VISYEYPLSERVRTLLRLEDLYERVEYFLAKTEPIEHHIALLSIFEILEVSSRADLKSDLLQELERQKQTLESLRGNPEISEAALDSVVWQIDQCSARLFQASGKVGQRK
jgi:cell division protein ZapD